jgi:hypothetical protein
MGPIEWRDLENPLPGSVGGWAAVLRAACEIRLEDLPEMLVTLGFESQPARVGNATMMMTPEELSARVYRRGLGGGFSVEVSWDGARGVISGVSYPTMVVWNPAGWLEWWGVDEGMASWLVGTDYELRGSRCGLRVTDPKQVIQVVAAALRRFRGEARGEG